MRFIKVNELNLIQTKFFSFFFHLKRVAIIESKLFYMAHSANNEQILYHSNVSFKCQLLYAYKLMSLG